MFIKTFSIGAVTVVINSIHFFSLIEQKLTLYHSSCPPTKKGLPISRRNQNSALTCIHELYRPDRLHVAYPSPYNAKQSFLPRYIQFRNGRRQIIFTIMKSFIIFTDQMQVGNQITLSELSFEFIQKHAFMQVGFIV